MLSSLICRRVRRKDLESSSLTGNESCASSSDDDSLVESAQQRISSQWLQDVTSPAPQVSPAPSGNHSPSDAAQKGTNSGYAFRLFSRSGNEPQKAVSAQELPVVDIGSPDPDQLKEAGFVRQRPEHYYFVSPPSQERLARLQQAAVTGQEILARTQIAWVRSLSTS